MIRTVFFDLDGTLVDPKEGIINSFQFALKRLGRFPPAPIDAAEVIGPPLRSVFSKLLQSDDKDLIERAVEHYRKQYGQQGVFENKVYPGIHELLSTLRKNSLALFILTSKARIYAERISEHLGLSQWMEKVCGPELDGRFDDKGELLSRVLIDKEIVPQEALMVGDRREDIRAGKRNGLRTIGVTYGFGSEREIQSSFPDHICKDPSELFSVIHSCRRMSSRGI